MAVKHTSNTLIRLDRCPYWSEFSIATRVNLIVLSRCHSQFDFNAYKASEVFHYHSVDISFSCFTGDGMTFPDISSCDLFVEFHVFMSFMTSCNVLTFKWLLYFCKVDKTLYFPQDHWKMVQNKPAILNCVSVVPFCEAINTRWHVKYTTVIPQNCACVIQFLIGWRLLSTNQKLYVARATSRNDCSVFVMPLCIYHPLA